MIKFISILSLLCLSLTIGAQHQIEGRAVDVAGKGLSGATAVLMDGVDSTMVSFAITNEAGRFRLEDVSSGTYYLQLSYVGYETLDQDIDVSTDSDRTIEIGSLTLSESSEILNEVTVTAEKIPMGLRGDTISYNADAFKTRPGANVEELLKKLPGVEVDRAGNIKAQGEDVENVLVDGKEFFGNDPLIATKNLEAEAVDKVEVFDKKSEIAEFTGVDDGNEEKTINLQLKEDHKSGGFGNVTVKGGTEESWLGKLNYNRFNTRMQASIIAAGNNINEQAFSFNEYISFMGGLGNAIRSGGFGGSGMSFGGGQQNPFSQRGITRNISIGSNFNYDFSKKLQLFSNYFYIDTEKDLRQNVNAQNFTETLNYESRDTTNSFTQDRVHRLNTKLKYKPNPFTEFMIRNNLQGILLDNSIASTTDFLTQQQLTSVTTARTLQNQDQFGLESNLQWRQKFKKDGRNWINQFTYKWAKTQEENDLLNSFLFLNENNLLSQFQDYLNVQEEINIQSNYTEPLGKKTYLGLSYQFQNSSDAPTKDFFDRINGEQVFNEDLSSIFDKSYEIHRFGTSIKKNTKKLKMNAGVRYQHTRLDGDVNNGEQTISGTFQNWLPSASLDFDVSRSASFSLQYFTQINSPSLNQLMPLPDNRDPNTFVVGNPNLIPEYNHDIYVNYHFYDQFNFTSLFANIGFNTTKHKIVNTITVQDDFTQVIAPINTDDFRSVNGTLSFSTPIRPIKLNTSIRLNYNNSNYQSFINSVQNEVNESTWNLTLKLDNRNKDKVDVGAGIRFNLNDRKFAVNEDFNQKFFNTNWFVEGDYYPTPTTTFSVSFDHIQYSGEFFSDERSFNLLNASISQKVFNERLTISLEGRDLLKQNLGLNRTGTASSLRQTEYNTLTRYVMIGLAYKLSKTKAPSSGIEISTH